MDGDAWSWLPSLELDVFVLGEIHDNPAHHSAQISAARVLAPKAIVLEFLTEAQAEAAMALNRSDVAALEQALRDLDWAQPARYAKLFSAAPEALILGVKPTIGDRSAPAEGDLSPDLRVAFGLDMPLPEAEQAARETLQADAHCGALPEEMLPTMVRIQRGWDARFAAGVLAAHEAVGAPVLLLTGNGHARTDWGVPVLLARARPDLEVMSFAQLETAPDESGPFDAFHVSPPPERDDPCAAFR